MSEQQTANVTDPSERQKFKSMLAEITYCYQRMDGEKEQIKEIVTDASKKYGIKKGIITKMARVMYAHNYADVQAENRHFENLYETLVEGKKNDEQE